MRIKTLSLLLCLALGPNLPTLAANAPNATNAQSAYASVEGISEYRLANGLRVLLAPDASKPTTTVNVTYLVGSRHEGYGETGMAHLLEHMLFKGTPSSGNIMNELSKRGMSFNGTTFFDRTNYFETFPADEDNLRWSLAMEADRMVNSKVAKGDLDSEFSVVRNEMEMGENSPHQVLWKQLSAVAFDWHNYGHNTIGARSDVENVRIENLQAFYRKYYQPDNAVLMVSGKFDPVKTLAQIQADFGRIAKPQRVLQPTWTVEPPRDGEREVTVRRVGDSKLIAALYSTSAGSHPDAAALAALTRVLNDTPTGRLYQALVKTKKAVSVDGWSFELAEPGYLIFWAELAKNQDVAPARAALLSALEDVRQRPVSDEELKRAQASLLKGIDQVLNDPQKLTVQLSESIAQGDWRLFFLNRDRIEALTTADLNRVAANYLQPSNRSFGQYLPVAKPERAQIPATPDVAKLVAGYQGKAAVAQGEDFDASPANIDRRTSRSTLDNGARLALLAKKTRGETVYGSFAFEFGDANNLRGQAAAAEFAAALLERGSQRLSRAEIADRLDQLKANLSFSQNDQTLLVDFKTVRGKLEPLLALIAELLQTPAYVPAEFDLLQKEVLTAIDSRRNEPQALAAQAVAQKLNPYTKDDIRHTPTLDESARQIAALKLDDVKRFQQNFYGANHADLVMVGDFDQAQVKRQLQQLFGHWNSKAAYQRQLSLLPAANPGVERLPTPDKANAVFTARLPLALRDSDADYPALLVANEVLGGGAQSRLMTRLRQQDGLSYGVGSDIKASSLTAVGSLNLGGTFAPANLARFQTGLNQELARLVQDGISEQELADAKRAISQSVTVALAQDGALAMRLNQQMEADRDLSFTARLLDAIAKLSVADVNAALRQHIDPAKLTQVYAGDFNGKTTAAK